MARNIFSGEGQVAIMRTTDDRDVLGALVRVTAPGSTSLRRVILTSMGFSQSINAQVMKTLENKIFVYGFGDNMGSCRIDGIIAGRTCESNALWSFENMWSWYRNNRLVAGSGRQTVNIHISRLHMPGFLTGFEGRVVNEKFRTVGFSLSFLVTPEMRR